MRESVSVLVCATLSPTPGSGLTEREHGWRTRGAATGVCPSPRVLAPFVCTSVVSSEVSCAETRSDETHANALPHFAWIGGYVYK